MKKWFYRLHIALMCAVLRIFNIFYRVKRTAMPDAQKSLPESGALVIANHTGVKDPLLVVSALKSLRMRYLVAENVMDKPVLGKLLHAVGCVRIDRTRCDLQAIKKAVKAMSDGFVLTMFPEGGIQLDQSLGSFKTGMILMAMQAGVPIVPVYLVPGIGLLHRQRAMIGKPFYVSDYCKGRFPSMTEMDAMAQTLQDYEKQMEIELRRKQNA